MADQAQPDGTDDVVAGAAIEKNEAPDWYLEMLGVRPEPRTRHPARSMPTDVSFQLEAPAASTSTPTPLERPNQALAPESSVPDPGAELEGWKPQELASQVNSRRRVPWGLLVTFVILVGAVIGVLVWTPGIVEDMAVEEAADYSDVMTRMRSELPSIQQTLATATEPSTSGIELFALAAELSRFDAASSEVVTRANRPLPDTFPLLPRGSLEELEATRSSMPALGQAGLGMVTRIGSTIAYRTNLDDILVYPSLPERADASQVAGLSLDLAAALTASVGVLSELPLDPVFEAHREQAAAAVVEFELWQGRFLEAIRNDDAELSAALIQEAEAARTELFRVLVPALATMRADVDNAIIALNEDITETIAAIPR